MNGARKELSLDGDWTLVLDPTRRGTVQRWAETVPDEGRMAVKVPADWHRWAPEYRGIGWYYKTFEVEKDWALPHVELAFAAADYAAEVWVNGHKLGQHEGAFTPFAFPVSEHLRAGENLLAVRINDPYGPKGCEDYRPAEIPCGRRGEIPSAGLTGSVTLRTAPAARITDVFIQPDLRRKRIAVNVNTTGAGRLVLRIEGTDQHLEAESGEDVYHVEFPSFTCWSPKHPQCYTLRVDLLQDDASFDTVSIPFGMRDFTIKDQRFYLNNHPLFIKGIILGGEYPATLARPHDPALLRQELQLIKDAGFNMVRFQGTPPLPEVPAMAGELGLLVSVDMPIGTMRATSHMQGRCEQAVRELVLRDRNHPSIVMWTILDNPEGSDATGPGDAAQLKDSLAALARGLDPTRVILDICGDAAVSREPGRYMRPYRDELEPLEDLRIRLQAPLDLDGENYLRHCGRPDRLSLVTSFGLGGPEDLAASAAAYGEVPGEAPDAAIVKEIHVAAEAGFRERELESGFGNFGSFLKAGRMIQCDAAKGQMDALRGNGNLAGYWYDRWADGGRDFCTGLADRWRRPKPVLGILKHVQTGLRPLIQAEKTNLLPREEVNVSILLANEVKQEGQADLSLQVVGPTNQVLWKKKRGVRLPKHGRELWNGSIAASGSTGIHRFVVRLSQKGQLIAQSSIDLHVFKEIEPSTEGIHLLDPHKVWGPRCKRLARLKPLTAPVHVVPPLGNTIRAYPENDLVQILAQVREGAVAVVFSPPDDWNDLADQIEDLPRATSREAFNAPEPVVHYTKLHPILEGLPARGLMRQAYRNVIPPKTFVERGDEDVCGTWDTRALMATPENDAPESPWGSDILVQKYSAGRIVFTHMKVLENLGEDPAADRLFVNLVQHLSRRSVPPEHPVPLDRFAVEWIRSERVAEAHRWMVIGEFPSPGGAGHETVFPPEEAVDLEARYPGWYRLIGWRPWYSLRQQDHWVDLQSACAPVYQPGLHSHYSVAYAYAEFACERRQEVDAVMRLCNDTKVWLNGKPLYEGEHQTREENTRIVEEPVVIKQGRNTVLVKCTRIPGLFGFSFDLEASGREPLQMKWWK
jgi:hypothetical protein